jgi:hypothetical protein
MEQKQSLITHNDIGARFVFFCEELDRLKPQFARNPPPHSQIKSYPPVVEGEDYLITLLKNRISSAKDAMKAVGFPEHQTRSGEWHTAVFKGLERATFPRPIRRGLEDIKSSIANKEHCELSWVVCYLEGIRPNKQLPNWEQFECSHKCIEWGLDMPGRVTNYCCIDPDCLVWESKSVNQSRGNDFCMRTCTHCNKFVCHCQGFHNPPCK